MRSNVYTQIVLTIIAVFLGVLAIRPAVHPVTVQAQSESSWLYVEPQTTTIRKPDGTGQMPGRMVVNLRTGEIWGFPTLSDLPYPVNVGSTQPPVSEPMYLGKFDLTKVKRGQ